MSEVFSSSKNLVPHSSGKEDSYHIGRWHCFQRDSVHPWMKKLVPANIRCTVKPTSWSDHHKLIDPHVCVRGTEFKKKLVQSLLMHVLRALCTQGWVHQNSKPLCKVICFYYYLDFSVMSQSLGKAQQHYPFLLLVLVCAVFGIFNLCTDVDA